MRLSEQRPFFYKEWMEKEGVPIYETPVGIEDVAELPRRPWARMGGSGTFIELDGAKQDYKGLYVVEIPAGGALEPEKHLYDELICILRGRGLTEVWQGEGRKRSFEWGEGSLFAMPTNLWHRLVNGGREPVILFVQTNAPAVMNAFRNAEFIFDCDYNFTDRYAGQEDYFQVSDKRYTEGERGMGIWETNFIPDVSTAFLGVQMSGKVEGGQGTFCRMASWTGMHFSEWPPGKYHKAHYHAGGAVLLGLKSEGYVLVWPREYGIHPYQDGHGDKVLRADWKPGGIYSPCNEWFHQHFNTGTEPARHLAVTGGGVQGNARGLPGGHYLGGGSVRESGSLIQYDDEDPEIRRLFKKELRQKGIVFTMEPVVYRRDPLDKVLPFV
ncbi:MAG: cupin domain-containing protein [Chloroflexi bacterium]|nr:cupin domain-containing protein [Chloroflexota bacterium]MBI3040560.1 cupin domain-containing protein [Chloroflexota bacterium]